MFILKRDFPFSEKTESPKVSCHHYNFRPILVCTPNFGVVKYSYIQAIVLSFVEQFPTIRHVSEDRKPFEVGEIFYLLF